jgi:hypothetical protein
MHPESLNACEFLFSCRAEKKYSSIFLSLQFMYLIQVKISTSVCVRNEVSKTVLQYVDITEGRCLTDMLLNVPRVALLRTNFREIGSGIQLILQSFSQQFQSMQC